jgi:dolichol-phosphate mannosyltransferase
MERVEISVVVPVYRCATCLTQLVDRLKRTLDRITGLYEIILVDDRSPDDAWQWIAAAAAADPHVHGIRLSRNFGQHAALTAGLAASRGRWIVAIDCDLQDPPEAIAELYAKAQEGYDVVLARRISQRRSRVRRVAAALYFRMLRTFIKADIHGEYGTFSIVSRKVVGSVLRFKDEGRHYLFILHWLGYARSEIEIVHGERASGRSSYTFGRLARHALDGIFFQTTVLLRWIVYLGFFLGAAGSGLAAYLFVYALVATPYPGWTSLAVLILLTGGFIITALGVAALYIGQIFDQVKARPLYVVDELTVGTSMAERELTVEAGRVEL